MVALWADVSNLYCISFYYHWFRPSIVVGKTIRLTHSHQICNAVFSQMNLALPNHKIAPLFCACDDYLVSCCGISLTIPKTVHIFPLEICYFLYFSSSLIFLIRSYEGVIFIIFMHC